MRVVFCLAIAAVACGSEDSGEPEGAAGTSGHSSEYVDGFDPPAPAEGATRYASAPIEDIEAGGEGIWCQWLSEPLTEETDVLSVSGYQSTGGHHALLYATEQALDVGTTKECNEGDLAALRFLGGIGGEGTSGAGLLPEGVVYRIPAGYALMANVHYVNYSKESIAGQAVLDLEFAEPDPEKKVASLYANITPGVKLPPHAEHSMDLECEMQEDLSVFLFTNHMHQMGVSAYTEMTDLDGKVSTIRRDDSWDVENRFNPDFERWSIDSPLSLKKGQKIHTHCAWNNPTSDEVAFPGEMCAGLAFFLGDGVQILCVNGNWLK